MTVAEVEVLVTGNDSGAHKALDRTTAAIGKLAKEGKAILDEGAKGWGDAITQGVGRASLKASDAVGGIRRAVVEMAQETDQSMKKVGASGDDAAKRLKATESVLRSFGSTAQGVGIGLSASVTAPLLLAAKAGLSYAGDFEQSMAVFKVTSTATADEMAKVGKAARDLGADVTLPGTSATDAAHAMLELSKAGLSVKDTLGAADGVLRMSAAAQIDNATAAKITAEALTAFSLAGTKANMVSDLLASAANASTASMTEIADGLQQSGAVYATAKISIQDLTTGLSMLANAGIKGSDAGTSMKQMLIALENPPKDAANEMKKLGVSIYDASGKMVDFKKIIGQFETATRSLTAKQRDHALATIFGSDAVRAASVIVGQGVDKFDALERVVTKQGVAAQTAGAYNEGFKGSLDAATSSGQTLLQGFLEPSLKPLTQFFKTTSDVMSAMGDWSPAAKSATVAGGLFLATLGPGVLALGAFARGITSIIGLKGAFAAAEASKAAALTATTVAATAATTAETAEATATGGMSISALLAEPALLSEAAALDTVAASATAATGAVGLLTSALSVVAAAAAGAAVGTAVSHYADSLAQGKGYDNLGAMVQGKLGGDNAEEAAGDNEAWYSTGAAKRWAAAHKQRDAATELRKYLDSENKKDAASVVTRAKEKADAESKAAAARYTKLDVPKAKKPKRDRAADKEAREEAAAIKALSDQYYEAAKSVALFGKEEASVSLQYDIDHGKIKAANAAQAETVVGQLKRKEALDATSEAEKKAADDKAEWSAKAIDHMKAMGRAQIGVNELDAASLDLFGKKYAALTDVHNKQEVLWAVDEARAKLEKDRYDAGQQFARDTIDSLTHEIALKSALTRVDGVLLDIKERRAKGETITADQAGEMLGKAKILDDADWAKQLTAFGDQLQSNIDELVQKAKDGRDAATAAALGRYSDALAEVRERLAMAGDESEKYKAKTVKLAEAFGTGTTAAARITSGMGRANLVMAATLRADRVEAFRVTMKGAADSIGDYFGKTATSILTNFSLSFKGVANGFGALLADMARQQAAASAKAGVSSLFGKLLSSVFGGGMGSGFQAPVGVAAPNADNPFYHATGGPVLANQPIMVGENGPEMFIPSGHGSIATATQTKNAVGGRPINLTINVAAPNPGAFHESVPQIAQKVGQAIRQATNGLG